MKRLLSILLMIALVWGCRERQLPKPNLPTSAKPLSDPLAIRQQQLLQNAQQLHQTQTTLLTPQAQATQGFVELPTPLWNRATTKVLADGQILLHVPLQYQIDTTLSIKQQGTRQLLFFQNPQTQELQGHIVELRADSAYLKAMKGRILLNNFTGMMNAYDLVGNFKMGYYFKDGKIVAPVTVEKPNAPAINCDGSEVGRIFGQGPNGSWLVFVYYQCNTSSYLPLGGGGGSFYYRYQETWSTDRGVQDFFVDNLDTSGLPVVDAANIDNQIENPCLKAIGDLFISNEFNSKLSAEIFKIYGASNVKNITFREADGIALGGKLGKTEVYRNNDQLTLVIYLNKVLSFTTNELCAAVLLHELIHAYLESENRLVDHHYEIAETYSAWIEETLSIYFNTLSTQHAKALSLIGLRDKSTSITFLNTIANNRGFTNYNDVENIANSYLSIDEGTATGCLP